MTSTIHQILPVPGHVCRGLNFSIIFFSLFLNHVWHRVQHHECLCGETVQKYNSWCLIHLSFHPALKFGQGRVTLVTQNYFVTVVKSQGLRFKVFSHYPSSLPQDATHITPFQGEASKPHSHFKFPFCLSALLADQQVRICLSGIFPTGSRWDEL